MTTSYRHPNLSVSLLFALSLYLIPTSFASQLQEDRAYNDEVISSQISNCHNFPSGTNSQLGVNNVLNPSANNSPQPQNSRHAPVLNNNSALVGNGSLELYAEILSSLKRTRFPIRYRLSLYQNTKPRDSLGNSTHDRL